MGKKSKAKASKSAEKPSALATAGTPVSNGTSNKKERCVGCLALLKNLAKAHACPGCPWLYCWRCEKKRFEECPNGKSCLQPAKRCTLCIDGEYLKAYMATVVDAETGNPAPKEKYSSLFLQFCENERKHPNLDSMPLQQCGADGCSVQECYRCLTSSDPRKLNSCSICCSVIRCFDCMHEEYAKSDLVMNVRRILVSNMPSSQSKVVEAAAIMRKAQPAKMLALCSGCGIGYCLSCMDDTSIQIIARSILNGLKNGVDECEQFQCSRCYWASKPCTNPNCPNDAGIPTKRCGGCHLDRYCSVECQAAVYPDHVGRCKQISEKRTSAGKE